jgi:hypothetical protein
MVMGACCLKGVLCCPGERRCEEVAKVQGEEGWVGADGRVAQVDADEGSCGRVVSVGDVDGREDEGLGVVTGEG